MFFLQKFPFSKVGIIGKFFREGEFFGDLVKCPLCLGVWVYTVLSALSGIVVLNMLVGVDQIVTGMVSSLVMHLICVGWQTEFAVIEVN
jgi:hypothetical protein